jgi:CheY-like chemotaxis protein
MKKKLDCVLLIDDDDVTNFMNRMIIAREEIANHIEVALNGKEAIEYLCQNPTEKATPKSILILLDINMPVMDGWEFLQAYHDLHGVQSGQIIIFMLTTSSNPGDKLRAEKIPEVAGFLNKPLRIEIIGEIIEKFF